MATISAPPHNEIRAFTLGRDQWAVMFQSSGIDREQIVRSAKRVGSWLSVRHASSSLSSNGLIVIARWRWLYRFLVTPVCEVMLEEMDFAQGRLICGPLPGERGAAIKIRTIRVPDFNLEDPRRFPPSGML